MFGAFNYHDKTKEVETMNNKKVIPMTVPGIGGGQKQSFDISQAEPKRCAVCGSEFFDEVYRIGIISKFAAGNTLNQDLQVKFVTYLCHQCGHEFGKPVPPLDSFSKN